MASNVLVSGLTSVTGIASGFDNSFFLATDGTVKGLGSNLGGSLGDGTTTAAKTVPVTVTVNFGVLP
ncbi:MAG: hypothetical protein ACOYM2_08570 [Rectinemataceae bacterium]